LCGFRLIGKNGLTEVQDIFKDFKFLGKGKEKEDLSRILSKYEQWIHKLHPKYPFDQCVERIEYLGLKKKPVKTMLKKIRMGLISSADFNKPDVVVDDDEDDQHLFPNEENIPMTSTGINDDEFDAIMDEMESMSNTNAATTRTTNADYDDGIPSFEEQMELEREMNSVSVPEPIDEIMSDSENNIPSLPKPDSTDVTIELNKEGQTSRDSDASD